MIPEGMDELKKAAETLVSRHAPYGGTAILDLILDGSTGEWMARVRAVPGVPDGRCHSRHVWLARPGSFESVLGQILAASHGS